MASSIAKDLAEILDSYSKEVREAAKKDIEQVAKSTAKSLRQTSPKSPGGGEYARSWTATRQDNGWIVHNKRHYRLTHLLENGHVIRNQYGTWGRAQAEPHIKDAEEQAIEELVRKIEEDLNQ